MYLNSQECCCSAVISVPTKGRNRKAGALWADGTAPFPPSTGFR